VEETKGFYSDNTIRILVWNQPQNFLIPVWHEALTWSFLTYCAQSSSCPVISLWFSCYCHCLCCCWPFRKGHLVYCLLLLFLISSPCKVLICGTLRIQDL